MAKRKRRNGNGKGFSFLGTQTILLTADKMGYINFLRQLEQGRDIADALRELAQVGISAGTFKPAVKYKVFRMAFGRVPLPKLGKTQFYFA